MATVTFQNVTRMYPRSERPAVDKLNLKVNDGEFLVLVGPSGCGKTTTLRMIAGLEPVDEGDILIDDQNVLKIAARDRDIAMVFQNYALYPHMNVAQNMGFALKMAKVSKQERDQRVRSAARILALEDYLDRKPRQLSGGQRQRVAMGRAIVREPQVFLMDEPLSNLDAKLRVATRAEIAALQRNLGTTTLYVTHDQVEAMTMGDRVAVMRDGVVQQCDTPRALYDQPANVFVAGFIGSPAMNLLDATVENGGMRIGTTVLSVKGDVPAPSGARITVGLRPESLELSSPGNALSAVVTVVEELGAEAYVHAKLTGGADASQTSSNLIVRVPPRHAPVKGETINVAPMPDATLYFDQASGRRIEQSA